MILPDDRTAYRLACQIFHEGIECDTAAGIIRELLPDFLVKIAQQVKKEQRDDYHSTKEQPWLVHFEHGKGSQEFGPEDSDCPCRDTAREWECDYFGGCGFCKASRRKKRLAEGDPS